MPSWVERLWVCALAATAAGCAAMQPSSSGPWPPLPPREKTEASAPTAVAGPPAPATTPAPATVEPNAAPPPPAAPAALFALPEGWRAPNDAELEGPLLIRRGDSPSLYLSAMGDFNGDGRLDRAVLLVSDAQNQYGVFIDDGRSAATPLLVGAPGAAVAGLGLETTALGALRFFQFGASRFAIRWDGAAYTVAPEG